MIQNADDNQYEADMLPTLTFKVRYYLTTLRQPWPANQVSRKAVDAMVQLTGGTGRHHHYQQ
jgi:hypothetical protein